MSSGEWYLLFTEQRRGALHVVPQGATDIDERLLRGEYVPDRPVECIRHSGSRGTDLLGASLVCIRPVSERFLNVLRSNELTGWSTYPVEIKGKGGEVVSGYHGLAVLGRCGPIDWSAARKEWRPPSVPTGTPQQVKIGPQFGRDQWDGSDLFVAEGSFFVLLTQRARDALAAAKLTNVSIEAVSEFEMMIYKGMG